MGEESLSKLELEESVVVKDAIREEEITVPKQGNPWLIPLLVGTGLGVALSFGGMRLFSNLSVNQQPVATKSVAIAPNMTVTVALVETTRVARTLYATGSVAARDLTPVLPQANGLQIKQILVKEGEKVKVGQVMAILDDSLLKDQIRQAQAEVEAKQADVASKQADLISKQAAVSSSEAVVASNQAIVQQKLADLAQAKAKLREAQLNFDRNQKLSNEGAISLQQFDTATTNLATAREAVRLAEANIKSAQANVKNAQANIGGALAGVNIARANINSAQANVRSSAAKIGQLKTQLGQTVVRAPVSGVVAEKLARVGDVTGVPPQTQVGTVVGGTQKLFSIIQDGELELLARVPEIQLPQVRIDAPVQVTSALDSRVKLEGKVREIEPVVNQQRREATVKINLPATTSLKPGMFARAAITSTTTTGIGVPQKAVLPQSDGSVIVFMLSGEDTVRAQKVELGEVLIGGRVEVKKGLQRGDRIVVQGAGYLKDGDKVRVVNADS
ncbi:MULTISPECIES: efflux RND transporter periplasmic adaptor subunit [Nostocales]|uniref:RND transporter n=3 Tax=Nostocales TaxID=1161 RepID=A0A0C1RJB0_9CYAN|nr:efflux RND transporter periplasmic adaptor subunit [Tolypothrix bouteillei]KAF3890594.1 efflux RND transporter periplasmic adaptor subunit [Tolypothrix bouteillei VB521301]